MGESLGDKLKSMLKSVEDETGISEMAVVSREGLLIASEMKGEFNPDMVAAMAASMFGSASNVAEQLLQTKPSQVMIETAKGRVVAVAVGDKAVIVALAPPAANLGLILMELRRVGDKAAELID